MKKKETNAIVVIQTKENIPFYQTVNVAKIVQTIHL
jgi:hypothetical protein